MSSEILSYHAVIIVKAKDMFWKKGRKVIKSVIMPGLLTENIEIVPLSASLK